MAGINKVILVGHLGQDPEVKTLPSGNIVANFTIATSETFNDKAGQKQERTEWHRIVVYGKLAQLCGQYLKKGRQAYVEGRIQTRSWDDATTGSKRYLTEIIALTVQFLGSAVANNSASSPYEQEEGRDQGSRPSYGQSNSYAQPNAYGQAAAGSGLNAASNYGAAEANPFAGSAAGNFNMDDEIPF